MVSKHPLFIFHVNRIDLTEKAYLSVADHFDVILIDNSAGYELQSFPHPAKIYTPSIPLTFQQSQNLILHWAQQNKKPFYFWMHNDAEVIEDTAQKLIEYVENLDTKWGVVFTYYDTFCAFNTEALTVIGGWSTFFEQYHLDAHTYRKMRLAGYATLDTGFPCNHYNGTDASATLKSDEYRAFRNSILSGMYAHLYKLAWGGGIGKEVYTTPFDSGDLTI